MSRVATSKTVPPWGGTGRGRRALRPKDGRKSTLLLRGRWEGWERQERWWGAGASWYSWAGGHYCQREDTGQYHGWQHCKCEDNYTRQNSLTVGRARGGGTVEPWRAWDSKTGHGNCPIASSHSSAAPIAWLLWSRGWRVAPRRQTAAIPNVTYRAKLEQGSIVKFCLGTDVHQIIFFLNHSAHLDCSVQAPRCWRLAGRDRSPAPWHCRELVSWAEPAADYEGGEHCRVPQQYQPRALTACPAKDRLRLANSVIHFAVSLSICCMLVNMYDFFLEGGGGQNHVQSIYCAQLLKLLEALMHHIMQS